MAMDDEAVAVGITELRGRMRSVEAGVSNYVAFMKEQRTVNAEVRDFITRTDTRATAEIDFHNRRDQEIKDALAKANQDIMSKIAQEGLGVAKKSLMATVAQGAIALAALMVSILAAMGTAYLYHHSEVEPLNLFAPQFNGQVYSAHKEAAPQDAGMTHNP